MRLFIAAALPEEHLKYMRLAKAIINENSSKVSLTKDDNLHLTLHFLGDVSAGKCEQLISSLSNFEIPSLSCFTSSIEGYGNFSRDDGRLIYAKLAVTKNLFQLQAALGKTFTDLGLEVSCRRFKPHVTLARRTELNAPWQEVLKKLPLSGGSYYFPAIHLFQSEFSGKGMLYNPLFSFVS